jgi:hypothetical protein
VRITEIAWEGVYWVDVGRDMHMWRAVVYMAVNISVPQIGEFMVTECLFPFREGLYSMLGLLPNLWQVLMSRSGTDGRSKLKCGRGCGKFHQGFCVACCSGTRRRYS